MNNAKTLTPMQLLMPQPLRLYRREIAVFGANTNSFISNRRISNKIDVFDMPGSTIVSSVNNNPVGICNTLDFNYPNNTTELPAACKSTCISDPAKNARKRVRSAGMIKRVFNSNRNNSSYCTNTNQYLIARNLAFSTNQYNFLRQGNPSLKPGPGVATSNLYSTGGASFCDSVQITSSNNRFSYYWINGILYNITIPVGSYNFASFVTAFTSQIFINGTYLIDKTTLQKISILTIGYDNINGLVLLQSANLKKYNNGNFTDNISSQIILTVPTQSIYVPYYVIPSTGIQTVIGFSAGTYNNIENSTTLLYTQTASNISHSLIPNYVTMNYKPNNSKFAQQGAVSSSAALLRKKYDTITSSSNTLRGQFRNATANAMTYGVSDNPFTLKTKLGYPNHTYPTFKNGKQVCISENCEASMRVSF